MVPGRGESLRSGAGADHLGFGQKGRGAVGEAYIEPSTRARVAALGHQRRHPIAGVVKLGRHAAFRAQCPKGRAGSNPALGTMTEPVIFTYEYQPVLIFNASGTHFTDANDPTGDWLRVGAMWNVWRPDPRRHIRIPPRASRVPPRSPASEKAFSLHRTFYCGQCDREVIIRRCDVRGYQTGYWGEWDVDYDIYVDCPIPGDRKYDECHAMMCDDPDVVSYLIDSWNGRSEWNG